MNDLLGKNLKFLRVQKQLSQADFAVEIGLNRGNIASYEKGTAEPNLTNILKIVKYFNIELSDLLERDLAASSEFAARLQEHPKELISGSSESLMIEELEDHAQKMERFLGQSNDMQKIVEGFKSFYQFKKSKGQIDFQKMEQEYEKLLDVMESLLESHNELIEFLGVKK